jgi:cupin fold WbuC family metalloprotein
MTGEHDLRHDPTSSALSPRVFDSRYFDELVAAAGMSARLRQHDNLHASPNDPCQRLFNAIGQDSYIRPHRHNTDPKVETLVAVWGRFALLLFNDLGGLTDVVEFGVGTDAMAIELPPALWHTIVALTPQAVLFEAKAGPFNPSAAKELAPWAPDEGSGAAAAFLAELQRTVAAPDGAQYCRAAPGERAR